MGESRDAASDSRANRDETNSSTEQVWSPLYVGGLFVAAAAVSLAVHALSGDWPAGYGGWVASAFAVVGVALFVYAFAAKS